MPLLSSGGAPVRPPSKYAHNLYGQNIKKHKTVGPSRRMSSAVDCDCNYTSMRTKTLFGATLYSFDGQHIKVTARRDNVLNISSEVSCARQVWRVVPVNHMSTVSQSTSPSSQPSPAAVSTFTHIIITITIITIIIIIINITSDIL